MSDEPEARMWDDGGSRYESRGAYFESAFASSEHLDRAPLLADDAYTEVSVGPGAEAEPEHCHWKLHNEPPSAIPQLLTALVLCALFMLCELIGGYMAGSLSVMSDAAHMLSDCGGFALALLAFYCARRQPDVAMSYGYKRAALLAFYCARRQPDVAMSYGYKRAEVLGAMVSVLLIWILTGVFVYVAAVRLRTGQYDIQPDMMMLVSGAGVGFNVVLALVLHGCAQDIGVTLSCRSVARHASPTSACAVRLRTGQYDIQPDMMMLVSGAGVGFNVVLALVLHGCAQDIGKSMGINMYGPFATAMLVNVCMWAVTGVFVYVAAVRLRTGQYDIQPDMMMLVSGAGVGFNVVLALVLHGCAQDIGVFVYVAAVRLRTGQYDIQPDMMMLVSGAGVGFNVVLALVLHGCAQDIGTNY
ncbi:cation efflux family domain-containing protein [Phthorimaea operculella]|nr:cation efflux family domain-containing protein [Phthorimaea operculella]